MVRIRAPQLPPSSTWLNCEFPSATERDRPLAWSALRGQVVLLDFWTYGCINCLHIIPDLHYLEQKYRPHLTVIGIHTAKFEQEQNVDSIQQAIWRYGITHPVIVDGDRNLWNQYAVRAYPTFVLIDPQGYIVATLAGEGKRAILDELIARLLEEHAGKQPLSEPFLQSVVSSNALALTPLAFPDKVLAHQSSDTLFIADTGHHRVVITHLDGTFQGAIGTGTAGWQDGDWQTAQFASPRGMALDAVSQRLYVADAGNHRLRQIDLRQKTVTTLAGTGAQSQVLFPHGGRAWEVDLNSPWDLTLLENELYIAMAGSHQIWRMDLAHHTLQTYLGTGAEFCLDGAADVAAFAQPHGITTDGTRLFVADSETSSIRAIAHHPTPTVHTLCGQGELFQFGDRDGMGTNAQLQHCSGLVYAQGFLWVADTYNHKIKRVHPTTGECLSVSGNGTPGLADGARADARFSEPSGLSYANHQLYIADPNNHAIRCLNLDSLTVSTLSFVNLCSPNGCGL